MIDPFPIPAPAPLISAVKPIADALTLQSLPLHAHEVLLAAAFYTFTCNIVSPFLSARVCPKTYPRLSRRSKLNWDVHVVSFVQACIINALSLYIIWFDEERKEWRDSKNWEMRFFGYYGLGGLCQSFALGYFLWDFCVCSTHVEIFGWGMVAHAVCAMTVFALGYRPFIYFSAPVFLLYELSSPFLNIHWFCDKLNLTGSIYQAINGAFLVGTFFGCRIVWGLYSSFYTFRDMWWLIQDGHTSYNQRVPSGKLSTLSISELQRIAQEPHGQVSAFNAEQYIPLWLPCVYLASNLVLNTLNIFWFGKMIQTIRTRFEPPLGTKGIGPDKIPYQPVHPDSEDSDLGIGEPGKKREHKNMHMTGGSENSPNTPVGKGSVTAARRKAEKAMNGPVGTVGDTKLERSVHEDGHTSVEVTGSQKRSARSRRKA
ncbi:hypothetical protein LTR37_007857 [Vermiconidia calcicola]|uniref:Uncharacterized protein n=1 Tax=Vermiconidia calcicola TaxID=1690605 RepID=A0ACC3NC72_9PEZI|nr:hypothetical protein LTR37_007857 [Vermiconidia calcicola]